MDTYRFNKNAWHFKFMKWCWGMEHEDITNMCPYFWSTILTMVIFPVLLLPLLIIKGVKGYAKWKAEKLIQRHESLTNVELIQFYHCLDIMGIARRMKLRERYGKELVDKLDAMGEHAYMKANIEKAEREEKAKKRKSERRQTIGQFYKKTKWILNLIIYGCICIGLYYLWLLLALVYGHLLLVDWAAFFQSLLRVIGIILLTASGVAIGAVVLMYTKVGEMFNNFLSKVSQRSSGFFDYIGEWYRDNCPAIEWKDND